MPVPFAYDREENIDREAVLGGSRYYVGVGDEEFSLLHWAGSGETVLLVHANGFSAGTYSPLAKRMVAAGYNVLALDLRSHGRTAARWHQGQHNWRTFGQDLKNLLAKAQEPVHLVGHSLGGLAAIYAVGLGAANINSLCLLDPTMFGPQYRLFYNFLKWSGLWANIPIVRNTHNRCNDFATVAEAFTHYRPKRVFAPWSDEFLHSYVASALKERADGGFELCCPPAVEGELFLTTPHYIFKDLKNTTPPEKTLLLYGEYSYVVSRQSVSAFKRAWPRAAVKLIPDGGHFFPMSHTDFTVRQWDLFLRSDKG